MDTNSSLIERANNELRELVRQNSFLKDSLFRKDKELIDLQKKMADAQDEMRFLSIALGVLILVLIGITLIAIKAHAV